MADALTMGTFKAALDAVARQGFRSRLVAFGIHETGDYLELFPEAEVRRAQCDLEVTGEFGIRLEFNGIPVVRMEAAPPGVVFVVLKPWWGQ